MRISIWWCSESVPWRPRWGVGSVERIGPSSSRRFAKSKKKILRQERLVQRAQGIYTAKVPIIKMHTGAYAVDLTVGAANGLAAVEWIRQQVRAFPPMRPLVLVLKRLLKLHALDDASTGGCGGYLPRLPRRLTPSRVRRRGQVRGGGLGRASHRVSFSLRSRFRLQENRGGGGTGVRRDARLGPSRRARTVGWTTDGVGGGPAGEWTEHHRRGVQVQGSQGAVSRGGRGDVGGGRTDVPHGVGSGGDASPDVERRRGGTRRVRDRKFAGRN